MKPSRGPCCDCREKWRVLDSDGRCRSCARDYARENNVSAAEMAPRGAGAWEPRRAQAVSRLLAERDRGGK